MLKPIGGSVTICVRENLKLLCCAATPSALEAVPEHRRVYKVIRLVSPDVLRFWLLPEPTRTVQMSAAKMPLSQFGMGFRDTLLPANEGAP